MYGYFQVQQFENPIQSAITKAEQFISCMILFVSQVILKKIWPNLFCHSYSQNTI